MRSQLRRQDLGSWEPPAGRVDPIDLIQQTNAERIPSLVPLRWTTMLDSPFAYLRGAAAVMAYDLAGSPTTGIRTQICGDAHLANFGLFAGTRQPVPDLNDFDESVPGPWEFDVKRLATSVVVAGRMAGIKDKACRTAAADAVRVYREGVQALAGLPVLTAWSASLDGELAPVIGVKELAPVIKAVFGKTRRRTGAQAAKRIAERRDGGWRFRAVPPHLTPLPEEQAAAVLAGLESYTETLAPAGRVLFQRFRPVDVALRVGGDGSIGFHTYVVLLLGNGADDPLILQVKEARVPTVAAWLGGGEPGRHQGERAVAAQQLLQTASDPLLGWTRIDGRDYYVREFHESAGSVDPSRLKKNQIGHYARLLGALLARAHCRGGDSRLLAGYLGRSQQFEVALTEFAVRYADQTEGDHAALVQAAEKGRIPTI
jgi:uncharacterized protein (DUF2252 family)